MSLSLRNSLGMFNSDTSTNFIEWSNKFETAGCPAYLIKDILQHKKIKNIENLYQAFLRVLPDQRRKIAEGSMLALSGEKEAFDQIEHAIKQMHEEHQQNIQKKKEKLEEFEKLKMELENKLASNQDLSAKEKKYLNQLPEEIKNLSAEIDNAIFIPDPSILFYAALSGNKEILGRALALIRSYNHPDLWKNKIYNDMNIFHAAILSGQHEQVEFVLSLSDKKEELHQNITVDGFNVAPIHLAALSNSLKVIIKILEISDINAKDHANFNALDYAIVKGDQVIQQVLREKGLEPSENHNDFYFAGYEPTNEMKLSLRKSS